ncbi:MAG: tRNA adenosine(34) deaminase TadA [Succinivibrio sp.]|nr:tRNA adenosine(34) deaminase TadA [Succinivibrio sp.]
MELALAQARCAEDLDEIPVGCVIVDPQGRIVSSGCNQTITAHDPTAHAEIVALRRAGLALDNYRLVGLTMYVTLEPCCMCAGALIHSRIHRLVYGADDPKTGACSSVFDVLKNPRHNHIIEVRGGVLACQCANVLSAFFRRRRVEQKNSRKN